MLILSGRLVFSQSADVLEAESGFEQEPPVALALKRAVLGGRWAEASQLLVELGIVREQDRAGLRRSSSQMSVAPSGISPSTAIAASPSAADAHPQQPTHLPPVSMSLPAQPTFALQSSSSTPTHQPSSSSSTSPNGRRALFLLLRQKYLELLEQGQTKRALAALRSELARLAPQSEELHQLSGLIVCPSREDLYARARWDGAGGLSRQLLLQELQSKHASLEYVLFRSLTSGFSIHRPWSHAPTLSTRQTLSTSTTSARISVSLSLWRECFSPRRSLLRSQCIPNGHHTYLGAAHR